MLHRAGDDVTDMAKRHEDTGKTRRRHGAPTLLVHLQILLEHDLCVADNADGDPLVVPTLLLEIGGNLENVPSYLGRASRKHLAVTTDNDSIGPRG